MLPACFILVRTIFTGCVTMCYERLFPQAYWLIIYGVIALWDVFSGVPSKNKTFALILVGCIQVL